MAESAALPATGTNGDPVVRDVPYTCVSPEVNALALALIVGALAMIAGHCAFDPGLLLQFASSVAS